MHKLLAGIFPGVPIKTRIRILAVLLFHILLLTFAASPLRAQQDQQDQQPETLSTQLPAAYKPITGTERLQWVVKSTIGPRSLALGTLSAGWGTMFNNPQEYGPGWAGFGKRYGMRLTGVSTGNAMEAGVGVLWGEDPRYFRSGGSFGGRVKHIVKMTFFAYRRNGSVAPAYARIGATFGNNFLSGVWRVESEKGADQALIRSGWGFLSRLGGNALTEFWPDVRSLVTHRHNGVPAPAASNLR